FSSVAVGPQVIKGKPSHGDKDRKSTEQIADRQEEGHLLPGILADPAIETRQGRDRQTHELDRRGSPGTPSGPRHRRLGSSYRHRGKNQLPRQNTETLTRESYKVMSPKNI